MKTVFFLLLAFLFISFPGCSGSSVTDKICNYGITLCDISTTLCADIPGVPKEVCTYLNLACYNLNQLCLLRDSTDSPGFTTALTNLDDLTNKLRSWKQARDKTK